MAAMCRVLDAEQGGDESSAIAGAAAKRCEVALTRDPERHKTAAGGGRRLTATKFCSNAEKRSDRDQDGELSLPAQCEQLREEMLAMRTAQERDYQELHEQIHQLTDIITKL